MCVFVVLFSAQCTMGENRYTESYFLHSSKRGGIKGVPQL